MYWRSVPVLSPSSADGETPCRPELECCDNCTLGRAVARQNRTASRLEVTRRTYAIESTSAGGRVLRVTCVSRRREGEGAAGATGGCRAIASDGSGVRAAVSEVLVSVVVRDARGEAACSSQLESECGSAGLTVQARRGYSAPALEERKKQG